MVNEEIKKIQGIELGILKEVIRICEENHLRYYALGGTLLGAVRHQGFIPWDDDVDIGIPRQDYERFLQIAQKELPEQYEIYCYHTKKNEKRPIYACQVRDLRTKLIQHIAQKSYQTHVWIDVFPLDGVPDRPIRKKLHLFRLLYRRMRMQFSMFEENVHMHRKNRPLHEKLLIRFYQITKFGSHSDPYVMMEKLDRALRSTDYDRYQTVINFMGAWKLKEMFPKSVYGAGKLYPFEDLQICGPEDADFVLRQMYGDYMTPIQSEADKERHHMLEVVEL